MVVKPIPGHGDIASVRKINTRVRRAKHAYTPNYATTDVLTVNGMPILRLIMVSIIHRGDTLQ